MRGKTPTEDLAPLDLEIEATCRRNNAERRRALQERKVNPSGEITLSFESSSSFPTNLR